MPPLADASGGAAPTATLAAADGEPKARGRRAAKRGLVSEQAKAASLGARRLLNPRPGTVRDVAFCQGGFFDARDLLQVYYELLRRHLVHKTPVCYLVRDFGVSRQQFYLILRRFKKEGLAGIIPRTGGPRGPKVCTDAVLTFAAQCMEKLPGRSVRMIAEEVEKKFGFRILPGTLRRGLARWAKRPRAAAADPEGPAPSAESVRSKPITASTQVPGARCHPKVKRATGGVDDPPPGRRFPLT